VLIDFCIGKNATVIKSLGICAFDLQKNRKTLLFNENQATHLKKNLKEQQGIR